ncbi:hypothetical protein [Pseudarthrobacter phenanthrenivorans]|nr:hypothetical protein [Pseudarthrobacter phenanthrenivorans]
MTSENTTPEAPRTAANPTPAQSGGMPLAARRLLMIGGLCLPVGLIAGPFLLPAQLLAVAGVVLLAVAVSYQAGKRWFSRWSVAIVVAGGLWLAATAAYYASIMIAADVSAPLPGFAQILYNAGAVCFAAMAIAAVTAIVLRMLAGRRAASDRTIEPRP